MLRRISLKCRCTCQIVPNATSAPTRRAIRVQRLICMGILLPNIYVLYNILTVAQQYVVEFGKLGIDGSESFIAFKTIAPPIFSDFYVRIKIFTKLDPLQCLGERRVIQKGHRSSSLFSRLIKFYLKRRFEFAS